MPLLSQTAVPFGAIIKHNFQPHSHITTYTLQANKISTAPSCLDQYIAELQQRNFYEQIQINQEDKFKQYSGTHHFKEEYNKQHTHSRQLAIPPLIGNGVLLADVHSGYFVFQEQAKSNTQAFTWDNKIASYQTANGLVDMNSDADVFIDNQAGLVRRISAVENEDGCVLFDEKTYLKTIPRNQKEDEVITVLTQEVLISNGNPTPLTVDIASLGDFSSSWKSNHNNDILYKSIGENKPWTLATHTLSKNVTVPAGGTFQLYSNLAVAPFESNPYDLSFKEIQNALAGTPLRYANLISPPEPNFVDKTHEHGFHHSECPYLRVQPSHIVHHLQLHVYFLSQATHILNEEHLKPTPSFESCYSDKPLLLDVDIGLPQSSEDFLTTYREQWHSRLKQGSCPGFADDTISAATQALFAIIGLRWRESALDIAPAWSLPTGPKKFPTDLEYGKHPMTVPSYSTNLIVFVFVGIAGFHVLLIKLIYQEYCR
eukprot:gene1348-4524_t